MIRWMLAFSVTLSDHWNNSKQPILVTLPIFWTGKFGTETDHDVHMTQSSKWHGLWSCDSRDQGAMTWGWFAGQIQWKANAKSCVFYRIASSALTLNYRQGHVIYSTCLKSHILEKIPYIIARICLRMTIHCTWSMTVILKPTLRTVQGHMNVAGRHEPSHKY